MFLKYVLAVSTTDLLLVGSEEMKSISMRITVDSRGVGEDAAYECMRSNEPWWSDVVSSVAKGQLDVGDYLISREDGTPVACVERKSHADMAGSLRTNNHVKEQVCRLKAFRARYPDAAVFIVYEGPMSKTWYEGTTSGIPNRNVDMFLTCLCSREGLGVHHTVSVEHTARWICELARKESKGQLRAPPGRTGEVSEAQYVRTLAMSKTANLRATNQWTRLLMAVDGMGADKAIAVAKRFTSCARLQERLRHPEGVDEVASLPVKQRTLGPALAKKLLELFG